MLEKLNNKLRKIILAIAVITLVFKLTEKRNDNDNAAGDEGFQTEEFDDIW